MPAARIGLTIYREVAQWGVWHESADLLPASYSFAVQEAGGVALLLAAPRGDYDGIAARVLDGLDGLLLAGGSDVDPGCYGDPRLAATGPADHERDSWEIALTKQALSRNLPVLGVCRGIQVLNTALGGSLVQHVPDLVGSDLHCPVVGVHGRHDVRLEHGSRLGQLLGERTSVATYHHQAVDQLGVGLRATAWADDGLIEGVETAGPDWTVGVQWHPEVHDGAPLFAGFVAACESA
jgi:putative glutamine amidotransferase